MDAKRIFANEHGLRSGWRLLIWWAIALGVQAGLELVIIRVFHPTQHPFLDPRWMIAQDALILFIPASIATLVMARIERRTLRDYYVPTRDFFGRHLLAGLAWGFVAVTLLVGMIAGLGGYQIAGLATHGAALAYWTALWVAAAFAVGAIEELTFRAYLLRTLADGIGFWAAAVLLSLGFGALHYFGKPYERWEDFASTGLFALFLCLTVRRTGTLAFAIGWHMAFDWGAIFLYSGRNAGEFAVGHLLETSWLGPNWLTGGLLGPEASRLVFVVIAALFGAFVLIYRPLSPDARHRTKWAW